jgi:hypothetical protein
MGEIKVNNTPYGLRLRQEEKDVRILETPFVLAAKLALKGQEPSVFFRCNLGLRR